MTNCSATRGRGFGYPEATLEAARQSLKNGVRYLELDTRVDIDKVIYCYHHSRLLTQTGLPLLRDLTGDVVARKGVLRLDEVLDAVAKVIAPDQRLCLNSPIPCQMNTPARVTRLFRIVERYYAQALAPDSRS